MTATEQSKPTLEVWYNAVDDGSFIGTGHQDPHVFATMCVELLRAECWSEESIADHYPDGITAAGVTHFWVLPREQDNGDTWFRRTTEDGEPVTEQTPGAVALTRFDP